jgi:hypothetical protein
MELQSDTVSSQGPLSTFYNSSNSEQFQARGPVLQFQADPLLPAMLFREGVACSTKEYPGSKVPQAAANSRSKSVPHAVRKLGSHVCGEIDWKLHCLKRFVAEGAAIADSYGITTREFSQQHPGGQIKQGHWHEFCGWRNGGLSGAVNCEHCIRIAQTWAPPLQVGNGPPVLFAHDQPLQDANAPPLQDADAPPQDDNAAPLQDGPMPTTPRRTPSKHALSNPSSPLGSRAQAKIPKNESLVCENLEGWLVANRPGLYEWVESARPRQSHRVICLVCRKFAAGGSVKTRRRKFEGTAALKACFSRSGTEAHPFIDGPPEAKRLSETSPN